MQYVARWRMQLALTRLQETDARLADLASVFGYQSEAAFSRSFKRYIGVSPGAARPPLLERTQPRNSGAGKPGTSRRTANKPPASGSASRCAGVRPLVALVM
jgi:AraC-like DNA-binding protein